MSVPRPSRAPGPRRDLTQGPIAATLFWFSLPIVLQMSIQPLYGMIDRIFIGHISKEALAAVTLAGVLQFLIIGLGAALGNGATSYIARLTGAGDEKEADNAAQHALLLMLLCMGLILAMVPFDRWIFQTLGADEVMLPIALRYIRILLYGNVAILFTMVGANILRGEGNSRTPLTIAVVTVLFNLVLAPPLIFGRNEEVFWGLKLGYFGLDVFGAALASLIVRILGCLMLLAYVGQGQSVWTLSWKNFRWRPRHFFEILRISAPMLAVNFMSLTVIMVFMRVLTRFGAAAVAVYGVGAQLDTLAVLPMIGLMIGVIGMVGQNFGAGRLDRVKRTVWVAGLITAGFSGLFGLIFILAPNFWIGLFNHDPEILALGRNYLYIVSGTYVPVGIGFVIGGVFQGLGKGLPWLWITAIRFLGVSIPLALILSHYFGANGAWVAIASAHVVAGILSALWILREFRQPHFLPSAQQVRA